MLRVRRFWLIVAALGVVLACSGPATPSVPPDAAPTSLATATFVPTAVPTATSTPAPTATATAAPTPFPTATPAATPTATPPAAGAIEVPAAGARVTLPLHVLAHVGKPGERVTALLRWQDGTQRTYALTALKDADGRGLVIGTPPWWPDTPPQPRTQPATLELRDASGALLGSQSITVLDPSDPGTQQIKLYWTVAGSETLVAEPRTIVRTERVGAAALEELLWGPPPASNIGYTTALPTPEQVLSFLGRQPDWGARVTLRGLTIADGVATADFSREMAAYGGGSLRVKLIRDQINQTLRQFPSVRETRIAVEGQTEGVLEP